MTASQASKLNWSCMGSAGSYIWSAILLGTIHTCMQSAWLPPSGRSSLPPIHLTVMQVSTQLLPHLGAVSNHPS